MIVEINDSNWKTEVIDYKGVVIVDFFGTWCMPCKMLSPILERVAESRNIKLARVDIDDNDALVKEFRIVSVPTLKFFLNGEEVDSSVGLISESKLCEILDSIK